MREKKCFIRFAAILAFCAVGVMLAGTCAAAQETVLYGGFDNTPPDPFQPTGGVVVANASHLYGTTQGGGANDDGTVFELTESGGAWTENVIYSFSGGTGDGAFPTGGLLLHAGKLYGTAGGGTYGDGTVFELAPKGGGGWMETVLYNFGATASDGRYPTGGLAIDAAGDLYGATSGGGRQLKCGGSAKSGCGTVFELKEASGVWTETVLHNFGGAGDGQIPLSVIYRAGHLYGTTEDGGASGEGTLFELAEVGGTWRYKLLYSFQGFATNDGAIPGGGVILDASGDLWGTTVQGGVGLNNGIVFELTQAAGVWTEQVILSFPGSLGVDPDGLIPSGLTYSRSTGNFYGTMLENGGSSGLGFGTVFEVTPNGSGGWTASPLWIFTNTPDGAFPSSGVTLDSAGNLYGTTQQGGTFGEGAVYEVTP
jgi:uncharacterized repeat protein (TIGR03803 family)